ncbi:NmrA/HSCARG family protein [Nakamurella sp. A5-74]|uniref:NmrA/HSCARG family protein n=1 Tax=Nakamurella sp. A5-74 TaxID=3158264 RepID=A0AAU8DQ17_9ACTN
MSTPTTTAPIAILGATGQQGSAVVDALLAAGQTVRAIVRTPDSAKAQALSARGVEVVAGDQDDPDSLRGPLTGVAALFLMTTFTDDSGTEGEVRRGIATADVAAQVGVPRVVYSSVGGAERDSGVPHFESKYRVEQHLESLLPSVVVRPAFFMDNFVGQLDAAGDGEFVLRQPMPGDVPLQMIAVRDIGVIAAAALVAPMLSAGRPSRSPGTS